MITEPTPIDSVKTVICPKCQHSYYVDLHMSLKERVICAFCKCEVEMEYAEPAKLCSCNSEGALNNTGTEPVQYTDTVKVTALLHYRMKGGAHIIQIDPPRALQNTKLFRCHCQHAIVYINPIPIPAQKKYGAELVKIQELADDNLKIDKDKVK